MNKIIFQFGLLVFFISVIFFSQKGFEILDVIVRSLTVFTAVTIMLSILALTFIKAINRTSQKSE